MINDRRKRKLGKVKRCESIEKEFTENKKGID